MLLIPSRTDEDDLLNWSILLNVSSFGKDFVPSCISTSKSPPVCISKDFPGLLLFVGYWFLVDGFSSSVTGYGYQLIVDSIGFQTSEL